MQWSHEHELSVFLIPLSWARLPQDASFQPREFVLKCFLHIRPDLGFQCLKKHEMPVYDISRSICLDCMIHRAGEVKRRVSCNNKTHFWNACSKHLLAPVSHRGFDPNLPYTPNDTTSPSRHSKLSVRFGSYSQLNPLMASWIVLNNDSKNWWRCGTTFAILPQWSLPQGCSLSWSDHACRSPWSAVG